MLVHEHVQAFFVHSNFSKSSKVIGYYHTLMSKDFLGHYFYSDEINSIIFPDLIITNGNLAKEILIERGIPKNKILAGPNLRYSKTTTTKKYYQKNNIVLVPLPLADGAILEIMINVLKLTGSKFKDSNIIFKIKPHPMTKKTKILNLLGWESYPKEIIWTDQDISECLKDSKAAITFCTGSIIDVVLSNTIPIPLMPELDFTWNNLDILEDRFEVLRPVKEDNIKERINDIFLSKPNKYKRELSEINSILRQGLNNNSKKYYQKLLSI